MKRVIAFLGVFFLFDRFMDYKIEQARCYSRLELAKKEHSLVQKNIEMDRLAHAKQAGKSLAT